MLKAYDFVQRSSDIEDFGIVLEVKNGIALVTYAYMADNYGTREEEEINLTLLPESEIQKKLKIIRSDIERFLYFIVQLNTIPELYEYHTKETPSIRAERERIGW